MNQPAYSTHSRRGVSLIEVMVALTILTITMLVAYDSIIFSQRANKISDEEIVANRFIEQKLEEIRIDQSNDYTTFARKWNGLTYDDPPGVTTTYNAYSKWTVGIKDSTGTVLNYYPSLGVNYYYIDELRENRNEWYKPTDLDPFTRAKYLPQAQFVVGVNLPLNGVTKTRNIIPECTGQITSGSIIEHTGYTTLKIPPLPGSTSYNLGDFEGVPFFELDCDPSRYPDSYFDRLTDNANQDTTKRSRSWTYTIDVDGDGIIGDVFYADAAGYKKIAYPSIKGQDQYNPALIGVSVLSTTILTVPVAARVKWYEGTPNDSAKYKNMFHQVEVHTVMAYTP